jgi:hypothetical protein
VTSKKKTASTAKQVIGTTEEEISGEILAAIVAAATAFLGTQLRIVSVKVARSSRGPVSRWSRQGRASVHASHNPRSRR